MENGDLSGAPDWFLSGLRAVALAPSALGKQPVRFTLLEDGKTVLAQPLEGVQADICLASHGIISRSAPAILISSSADSTGPAWPFSRISRTIVQIQL